MLWRRSLPAQTNFSVRFSWSPRRTDQRGWWSTWGPWISSSPKSISRWRVWEWWETCYWMALINLKDAYLQLLVTIWEGHWKYLRFLWKDSVYKFQCFPFSLYSAPHIFTKLLKPVLTRLRQQGIRLIMYLDGDGTTQGGAWRTLVTDYLSTGRGRRRGRQGQVSADINPDNTISRLQGGFQGDENQTLRGEGSSNCVNLPESQKEGIHISVRDLARLIGKMTATLPAIFPALLWYREQQRLMNQAFQSTQSFKTPVRLNQEALLELDWWSVKRNLIDGKSISAQEANLIMETDAAMLGWGAVCQSLCTGYFGLRRNARITSITWNSSQLCLQWKHLPRTGGTFWFTWGCTTEPVFYVNRMGGTRSSVLSRLTIQLWHWCLEKNPSITAEHLTGVDNCVVDEESRAVQSSAEWQLYHPTFQQILATLGSYNIDLFATHLNAQLSQFVSWRPDPNAVGTNALQLLWSNWEGYTFPPFCLIDRWVKKVREDRVTLIMVAPIWQSQPCYPVLLELLVDFTLILPGIQMLLTDPFNNPHPLVATGQLQLAAWKLLGINSRQREFQARLPNCWLQDGAGALTQHMKVPERDRIAGALNGKLILFHALSSHF